MFYLQNLVTNTVYLYDLCIMHKPISAGLKKKKVKKRQCQLGKGLPASKLVWNEKKNPSVPGILIVILHQCLHKEQLPKAWGRLGGKRKLCFKLYSFPVPSAGSISHLQMIETVLNKGGVLSLGHRGIWGDPSAGRSQQGQGLFMGAWSGRTGENGFKLPEGRARWDIGMELLPGRGGRVPVLV